MYQYCGVGELPTDLNLQDDTIGPPPAFFRPSGVFFYGLGETLPRRPNPVKIIQRLKTNQEMPPSIPPAASRYTEIDPLSPMFRTNIPKYGFGEISSRASFIGATLIVAIILIVYFLKFKH